MKFLGRLFFLLPLLQGFSAETAVPIDLIASLLPENPIVIEAGAQFGEDTDKMSVLWPKGKLYAFEPSPSSYQSLAQLSLSRHNIFAFQMAVSNEKGIMPFYLAGGASSLLTPQENFNQVYFHVDVDHPIFVDVIRLDEWLEEQQIPRVDFLWLDMEGNELNALKGLQKHLADVTLIYTEVNIQRFWNDCVCYEELKSWLISQGFEEIWCEIVPHWQGNALFVNKKKNLRTDEL
jgi:FkbM family methyltransferase